MNCDLCGVCISNGLDSYGDFAHPICLTCYLELDDEPPQEINADIWADEDEDDLDCAEDHDCERCGGSGETKDGEECEECEGFGWIEGDC